MKYTFLLFTFLTFFACTPNGGETGNATEPTNADESAAAVPAVVQPPVDPSGSSPHELRNVVRNILRMELPYTFAEQRGERNTVKSYSFDVEMNNKRPTWIVKEKLHDAVTNKLYGGAEYMLLWEVIDPNSIKIINTPDGKMTSINIRPTSGNTFVYHPYTNEPDVAVSEVTIGYYDHVQDQTLLRLYKGMRQLVDKKDEWKED